MRFFSIKTGNVFGSKFLWTRRKSEDSVNERINLIKTSVIIEARVCGRSLPWIAGLNPVGGIYICLLWLLCCLVAISATGPPLVLRSSTECGVSLCLCDLNTPRIRRSWPALGCWAKEKKKSSRGERRSSVSTVIVLRAERLHNFGSVYSAGTWTFNLSSSSSAAAMQTPGAPSACT
jgi:hypothetical protein